MPRSPNRPPPGSVLRAPELADLLDPLACRVLPSLLVAAACLGGKRHFPRRDAIASRPLGTPLWVEAAAAGLLRSIIMDDQAPGRSGMSPEEMSLLARLQAGDAFLSAFQAIGRFEGRSGL